MNLDQTHILNHLTLTMGGFIEEVNNLETISIKDYNPDETMIVMIDMINGFCKFGPLSSDFVNQMVPLMGQFLDSAIERSIPIVSYRDAHPEDAKEFNFFPQHCVAGTAESDLVDELVRPELIDVTKNSTNAFLAKNPLELVNGSKIKDVLVIGCVTDICVRDFTATFIKHLQQVNQETNVLLVENLVDTFHIEGVHDRQVEHMLALYQLKNTGVKLVRI